MATRNGLGTYCSDKQNLDREISDLLIAISVKARRLAHKFSRLSGSEKLNEGGKLYGKSK